MAPYRLILKLDRALWLSIISGHHTANRPIIWTVRIVHAYYGFGIFINYLCSLCLPKATELRSATCDAPLLNGLLSGGRELKPEAPGVQEDNQSSGTVGGQH